jgi:protein-L-isoaspartate O-methyltransferase
VAGKTIKNIMKISEKEKLEIDFWRDSVAENPNEFTIGNIVNKMGECAVLLDIVNGHESLFRNATSILELGGGQGWASCVIKRLFRKKVILSDISEYAVQSLKHWEDLFKVKIDSSFACRSY